MTTATLERILWHQAPMLGFDLETTGLDVENDRIVTAALVHIRPGHPTDTEHHLINPGIEIPKAASDIHGITTEHAQANGDPPEAILPIVVGALADAITAGTPIVTMNGSYDLTLFDRECRRHGVEPLSDVVGGEITPVIDVYVIDKHLDPFRKGKRNLSALATHYGIQLTDAHNSAADATAALRIAYKQAARNPQLQIPLAKLHEKQAAWAKTQFYGYRQYLARTNKPVNPNETHAWPIRPRT